MNFKALPTTPLQRIIYVVVAGLLVVVISLPFTFRQTGQVAVDKTPPRFSASRAFETTQEYVTQFPTRRFGSLEARQSTGYLSDRLMAIGYEVEYINYDGRIGGGQQAGRNVLAYKQGETDEIIAVTAHFDTARPAVQGAAKNGAAVGVLMELAELFSKENTGRSLLFAFTDGGEWGSTGANDLVLNYEKKDRIAAALTLDYVVPGDLAGFRLDTIGQLDGSTPPKIRNLAEDVIKVQTPLFSVKSGWMKLLENVFMISGSEQGPFLKNGIPAINLGSFSSDPKREKIIIHSAEDKIENLKIETIDKYGRVAEQIVRSLTESPDISRYSYWVGKNVPGNTCFVMVIIMALVALQYIRSSRKNINLAQTGRELLAFLAAWIPFLILFLGIRLAYVARQFPFYDLYPAIAKDNAMQNPQWKVLAIIAVGTLFAAIAAWIIARYFLREWTKPDHGNSCVALWGVMAVTFFLAAVYNPFWAVVFFAAPAILWPMPKTVKNAEDCAGRRIFDIACIVITAIPACLAFWWLASQLGFGWNFFWYQTLAMTTGLFSPWAYFMGTAVIAVGIRLIVITQYRPMD